MKFGVLIFPGSNCDRDMLHVLENVMEQEVHPIWHKNTELEGFGEGDCLFLPGGFSYGDYLRPGAIAQFAPIMRSVTEFANAGGLVWGICNGFQILCENGLLPGALVQNAQRKFVCKNVYLRCETANSAITGLMSEGEVMKIPIAHADGRFLTDEVTHQSLIQNGQILFRYCHEDGTVDQDSNPNGTLDNIAGICNENRNVFGMMPHPERASEVDLGNVDGRKMFESVLRYSAIPA